MMDALTQAEYDRIAAGPHSGEFTLIHHKGPIVEHSDNIMERVEYILAAKQESEHYDRLCHIYYVPEDMAVACRNAETVYKEACRDAYTIYKEAYQDANTIYDKTIRDARTIYDQAYRDASMVYNKTCKDSGVLDLIPNCGWDGE